jgi:hypothetical protein
VHLPVESIKEINSNIYTNRCEYILSAHSSTWQINVLFKNCSELLDDCQKTYKLWFGEVEMVIDGRSVKIDNVEMASSTFMSGAVLVEKLGDYIQVSWSDGVRFKVQENSHNAFLTVEEQYRDKVRGLCGHYSSAQLNDMILHDMHTYTTDPNELGNSWRIDSSVSCCYFIFKLRFFFEGTFDLFEYLCALEMSS